MAGQNLTEPEILRKDPVSFFWDPILMCIAFVVFQILLIVQLLISCKWIKRVVVFCPSLCHGNTVQDVDQVVFLSTNLHVMIKIILHFSALFTILLHYILYYSNIIMHHISQQTYHGTVHKSWNQLEINVVSKMVSDM